MRIQVQVANGPKCGETILIDSGADRTVFSAALLGRLGSPATSAPTGFSLIGVGGTQSCLLFHAVLEFARDDGGMANVRGDFAAFTDPSATEMSVLGRDVLNNFDLILSRPRGEVLLLAGPHRYQVHAS
jgi:hypothetical protein